MKLSESQLFKLIKEEIYKLKESCGDPDEEELTPDQLASLEEPMDATADMSDEDVMRLAAALAAEAASWGDEDW